MGDMRSKHCVTLLSTSNRAPVHTFDNKEVEQAPERDDPEASERIVEGHPGASSEQERQRKERKMRCVSSPSSTSESGPERVPSLASLLQNNPWQGTLECLEPLLHRLVLPCVRSLSSLTTSRTTTLDVRDPVPCETFLFFAPPRSQPMGATSPLTSSRQTCRNTVKIATSPSRLLLMTERPAQEADILSAWRDIQGYHEDHPKCEHVHYNFAVEFDILVTLGFLDDVKSGSGRAVCLLFSAATWLRSHHSSMAGRRPLRSRQHPLRIEH